MRLPEWLRKNQNVKDAVHEVKKDLRSRGLHTVCEEARCPNKGECFKRGTATFLIMGNVCTRSCGFCSVRSGVPGPLDADEPSRVAQQVREMGLKHAVVTSVTRDDLPDGGAEHFAKTIREIRRLCHPERSEGSHDLLGILRSAQNDNMTIEVLTPDFDGREADIRTVCDARPHIFNHNVETVERLTPEVRSKASYRRSLEVLRSVRHREEPAGRRGDPTGSMGSFTSFRMTPTVPLRYARNDIKIKSGIMVGLGETEEEVIRTLMDLKNAGCDIVTIGQYLRPTKGSLPVKEYVHPDIFKKYELIGAKIGIKHMFCGPFVRSSYMAERVLP